VRGWPSTHSKDERLLVVMSSAFWSARPKKAMLVGPKLTIEPLW
jgi:hypothetical protein